jgi:hypothetical protein
MSTEKDNSEEEFEFFDKAAKEAAELDAKIEENMEDGVFNECALDEMGLNEKEEFYYVLIKDSVVEEAEIIAYDSSHYDLVDKLHKIIEEENDLRQKENDRPSSLMERKHPDFRVYWSMLEPKEIKKENELIRFGDGRISYRIEEL